MQEAAVYLRHELEAHALAYKAIKALPGTPPTSLIPIFSTSFAILAVCRLHGDLSPRSTGQISISFCV